MFLRKLTDCWYYDAKTRKVESCSSGWNYETDNFFIRDIHWEIDMYRGNGHQERLASIGGTFDTLHTGHKEYIRLTFEYADRVIIYVTSDEYINGKKRYNSRPYDYRVEKLEHFIQEEIECEKPYRIRCLHNQDELITDYLEKPDLKENLYMAVVSPEYYEFFLKINQAREAKGMKSFLILVKPRSYNPANNDISSFEVRKILPCPNTEYY